MTYGANQCDVCQRKYPDIVIAGVCASTLGPISHAICYQCLEWSAEPKWMLEMVRDEKNWRIYLKDFWESFNYYEDGSYHPATEIRDAKGKK